MGVLLSGPSRLREGAPRIAQPTWVEYDFEKEGGFQTILHFRKALDVHPPCIFTVSIHLQHSPPISTYPSTPPPCSVLRTPRSHLAASHHIDLISNLEFGSPSSPNSNPSLPSISQSWVSGTHPNNTTPTPPSSLSLSRRLSFSWQLPFSKMIALMKSDSAKTFVASVWSIAR